MKAKVFSIVITMALVISLGAAVFPALAQGGENTRVGPPDRAAAKISDSSAQRYMLEVDRTTITLDGNAADWAGIPPVVSDAHGDGLSGWCDDDIWDVYMTNDGSNLYFMVDLSCVGLTNIELNMDVDQNTATGYDTTTPDGWFINPHYTGIDYTIEVSVDGGYADLWGVYDGTGPDFNTYYIGSCPTAIGTVVEVAMPFSAIGSPGLPYNMDFQTWWYGPEDEAPNIGYVTYEDEPAENDWTFMVYLDGDNNLESEGIDDFLEMSSVGSSEDVNIVVQFDRTSGYASSYGDWTTCKRFLVTPGITPTSANAVEDIGEVNMGAPDTLVDFALWAISNYPAEHYALVLWDHGSGWKLKDVPQFKGVCWDDTDGGHLTSPELDSALEDILLGSGVLDIVGFDACLMGMTEIFYLIAPYADYGIASEEVEPLDGWPYDLFLDDLVADPTMTPANLADLIVDEYMNSYGFSGIETQSAVVWDGVYDVANEVSELATSMMASGEQANIALARGATESSDSDSDYIDLYHFAQNIQSYVTDSTVQADAQDVMDAIDSAVIAEGHGASHPNFHGMTIYYPVGGGYATGYDTDLRFTADTQWDEFLEWIEGSHPPEPTWTEIISDPVGDQYYGYGPDIVGVDSALTNSEPAVAFRVRASEPLDLLDTGSLMYLDTDQNPLTGYVSTDPEVPTNDIGADYAIYVVPGSMAVMGDEAARWLPLEHAKLNTGRQLIGALVVWNPVGEDFDFVTEFGVYTDTNYFWFSIPLSLLEDDGCMDVVEIIGDSYDPTDVAPNDGHGTTPSLCMVGDTLHINSHEPFLFVYQGPDCDFPDALTNIGPPSVEYPDALDCVSLFWGTEDVNLDGIKEWISYDVAIGAGFLGAYGLDAGQPYLMLHDDCYCTNWQMCQ